MAPILGIWASSRPSAAVDTGAMFPLQVITVGPTAVSDITFTNIPNTYTHLQIRAIHLFSQADKSAQVQFNSDTGNNYSWHRLLGDGSSAFADATSTTNRMLVSPSSSSADRVGAFIVDILDYSNTNKYKTVRSLGGTDINGATGYMIFHSGLWQSTSAVSSIKIAPSGGNFQQYSQFALYAVKAAS